MFKQELQKFIKNALIEDLGDGDHSSLGSIPKDSIWSFWSICVDV